MGQKIIREYGVAATLKFSLFEDDGVDLRVDAVHVAGDTVISKDEGAEVNTTNGFVDEGTGYSIVLTAAEMTAARIEIFIVDQTDPKAWLADVLIIETYGNAAAQHAQNFNESIEDGVWNAEIVAAHQFTNSAAFILSNLFKGQIKLLTGTASSTNNTVVLTSGETVDDVYKFSLISTHDDFPGQTRLIVGYEGSTKTVTVFPNWTTNPGTSNGVGTSLIILAAGVSPASVEAILRTFINESSAGRIGGNFEFFYDNSDQQTAKKVDDVGTAQLMAPKQFLATGQTIVQATIDSGGFADTNERLGTDFVISHDGTDLDVELLFNVGNLEKMVAFEVEAGLNTNGNRTAEIQLFDYIGTVFVFFKTIINSSGDIQSFFQSEIDPKFTDGNGDVRMRFKSVDLQSGNPINIAFIQTIANVNTGSIPSAIDNAIAVELVNSSLHGPGSHEGIFIITTKIDTVTSPTEFVLNDGPPNDITETGFSVLLRDQNNRNIGGFANVVSYTVTGKILIIDAAIPGYTVDVGDGVRFFKSLVSTDLNDNDTNKKIIAQAIKEFDASTLTIDNGSILKELFDQVFGVNIIQVDGATSADGNSFNFVLQAMAAMACGNFSLDTPVEGQTTFFKTDKLTPLFIVETTDVIRNRIL